MQVEEDGVSSEPTGSTPAASTAGRRDIRTVISDDEDEGDNDMIQSRKRSRKSVLDDSDDDAA